MRTTIKFDGGSITIADRNGKVDLTISPANLPMSWTRSIEPVQAVMLSQALDQAAVDAGVVQELAKRAAA